LKPPATVEQGSVLLDDSKEKLKKHEEKREKLAESSRKGCEIGAISPPKNRPVGV